jgi:metal-responsive CopG/Arc/MetJ family transcriptional regulator
MAESYARFTESFTISVTPEMLKQLDKQRRRSRQSRAAVVRDLLVVALDARTAGSKDAPPVR